MTDKPPPKKRGRKPKNFIVDSNNIETKPPPKKRGRKPKGGKIITPPPIIENEYDNISNIILHLKCTTTEINNLFDNKTSILNYNFGGSDSSEFCQPVKATNNTNYENESDINKIIHEKLKDLQYNLHTNNISDQKSACFWCTFEFDNPPIHIPKFYLKETYHVYGCFCSPECAAASLMDENIDSSTKFERYHLLNLIYTKAYNYDQNIKPSPDPHYTLDKFYGNLSIGEYRKLLQYDRLLFIVDKPLTRILPELHEDNSDFLLKTKGIQLSNLNIKKKHFTNKKSTIVSEKFGQDS